MDADTARLTGKTAIITGAGQGGGRGAALALARRGVRVVLFGRTAAKLEAVAGEIAAFGGEARVVAGDVTSSADRERCIDTAIEQFGRLDILVNTAQSPEQRSAPMLEVTQEIISQLWESGFVATLEFMRACYPHMRAVGGGSIINFGSGTQTVPKNFPVYAAVKAGVQAMSRAAALEWGEQNIRVNVVFPLVLSPAYDVYKQSAPELAADFEKRIPLGRVGDPEQDIGRAVAFLAGDDSGYITGTTLTLDGGHAFVR
jgi:NAD(P)-dependent dehydrogenase (short-subunit alcohol dehydrogenase family)